MRQLRGDGVARGGRWSWDCVTRCWRWCRATTISDRHGGLRPGLLAPPAARTGRRSRVRFRTASAEHTVRQIAQRYAMEYGTTRATAKIAVISAPMPAPPRGGVPRQAHDRDVLASPIIADPFALEMVMRCHGGAGVVVANADLARSARTARSGSRVRGADRVQDATYAEDLLRSPLAEAAEQAFTMAGVRREDIDMASIYDCYTITVLMSLEDAGFCPKGTGMTWVTEHDLTFRGDFPLNTAGGQLSFGQAGMAGGMHHVCDAVRQLTGRPARLRWPTATCSPPATRPDERAGRVDSARRLRGDDAKACLNRPVSRRSGGLASVGSDQYCRPDEYVFYPGPWHRALADDLEWRRLRRARCTPSPSPADRPRRSGRTGATTARGAVGRGTTPDTESTRARRSGSGCGCARSSSLIRRRA